MSERKPLPGKFVWFELETDDTAKAKPFYAEVLGWKTVPFPMGDRTYEMICAGETTDTMIGGYATPKKKTRGAAQWISYVSVEDVDAIAKAAKANGGKVLEPPFEIPGVGRSARIADPQGAELCLLKNAEGDPPDAKNVPAGRFFWNELHTSNPVKALAFYEKVLGFSHKSMDMGPGSTYYILSQGGVDRGGVTDHLTEGEAPHWLPYVNVSDPDATVSRARKLGATIPMAPEDIPGVGRFGVLQDPTGAALAIMKPRPMERERTA